MIDTGNDFTYMIMNKFIHHETITCRDKRKKRKKKTLYNYAE